MCSLNSNHTERMPTRVLDIGDQTSLRVLVTKGKKEQYATLSYCWGNPKEHKQPITTISNLEHREEVLYLTTLSPVFQDAIIITRQLGYRYLWIDSLCIIQDSRDDWVAEAPNMRQYYMGSSANIIAAAAKNPDYGIFDSADRLREEITYGCYYCGLNRNWRERRNFVQERAWTLQEELLSPRNVIYTDANIRWLCSALFLSEACLLDDDFHGQCICGEHREAKKQLFAFPEYILSESDGDEVHDLFFAWWYEILDGYVKRELSVETDRLPAIAGLAKEFGNRIKTPTDLSNEAQYYCGLWKEDFVRGLCWNGHGARIQQHESECNEGDTPEYLGPSWSWAALDPGKVGARFVFDRLIEDGEYDLMVNNDKAVKSFEIHVEGGEGIDDFGASRLKKNSFSLGRSMQEFSHLPQTALYRFFFLLCIRRRYE
jgi:hypothetical protein